MNLATAALLILYAALFGLFLQSVGVSMFQNLSSYGLEFWVFQTLLLLSIGLISVPTRRVRTWRPLARLAIVAVLLTSFFCMASLSDGFRY